MKNFLYILKIPKVGKRKLKLVYKLLKQRIDAVKKDSTMPQLHLFFEFVPKRQQNLIFEQAKECCQGDLRVFLNILLKRGYEYSVNESKGKMEIEDKEQGNMKDLKKGVFSRLGRVLHRKNEEWRESLLNMVRAQSSDLHGQQTFRE
jgi:hypothetical protein